MKIDNYSLKARYFPAVLSMVLPIMTFNHFYTSELFTEFIDNVSGAKILSNITISTIALFLVSQLGRIIGKFLEQFFFKDEAKFYTTLFLTYKDSHYPESYKISIASKIMDDFAIKLLLKTEEENDYHEAVKTITIAVGQIRKKLFKNKFLLQHNIEYGFLRNLIGGSFIGLILSVLSMYFFSNIKPTELAINISFVLGVLYFLIILTSKFTLRILSKAYAKIIFREYMS